MVEDSQSFEDLFEAGRMFGSGGTSLQSVASAHPEIIEEIKEYDPVKTASIFGGLLTEPELQSNCHRLEVLVQLALIFGHGTRKPSRKHIARWFATLGNGPCGILEDPAEDVFVTLVSTPKGNFRILEGIWESAGFNLQKILNIAEGLPTGGGYDQIRSSVHALLCLSELVCERSNLSRYQLGNPIPHERLPRRLAEKAASYRRRIIFSASELEEAGISIEQLAVFGFVPDNRALLAQESLGHSTVERYPVTFKNDHFALLLPTSVSAAIRRFVIEKIVGAGMREALLAALKNDYGQLFSSIPLLGGRSGAPIKFKRTDDGLLAGVMERTTEGRYLNVLFVIDTLENFESSGLAGSNPDPTVMADDFDKLIDYFYDTARKEDGFRECITLLVS